MIYLAIDDRQKLQKSSFKRFERGDKFQKSMQHSEKLEQHEFRDV